MIWSSHYQNQKRVKISIFLAFPILIGLFVGLYYTGNFLVQKTYPLSTKASEDFSVDKIIIGNLQHNSATIYWQTKVPAVSWIRYKKTSSNDWKIVKDFRQVANTYNLQRNHLATLIDLDVASEYEYEIINEKTRLTKHNGELLKFRTANNIKSSNNANPIYGKLITTTNLSVEGAVVLLESPDTVPLITTSKSDGSFIFSTCCLVNKNTKDGPVILPEETIVKLSFYDDKYKNTVLELKLRDTSPLLTSVIMGGDNGALMASTGSDILGLVNIGGDSQAGKSLTGQLPDALIVDYPKSGKSIPGTKPLFSGNGVAGKPIRIYMNTEKKEFEVTPTTDGKWQFSPKFDMKVGRQIVTISQKNANNKNIEQKIDFFIQKSGEAVLGQVLQATDEAGLTITPLPSSSSVTITLSPSTTPVIVTDTPIDYITATPMPPESGIDTIMPISMIGAGLLLFGVVVILGL